MRKGIFYDISDYLITENGEVINKHNNHVVKPQPNNKGYLRVCIGKKMMFVHRLVAEKYIPNPENKPQVNHIDGNKQNNNVSNLEWVSNLENRKHAVENGLIMRGEKCPFAKLTQKDVDYIRAHKEVDSNILSEKFHITPGHIRAIKRNEMWKS